jgi:hypothetical protein
MQLSFEAQLQILAAVLSVFGGVIGYLIKARIDNREYERRRRIEVEFYIALYKEIRKLELEDRSLNDKLVRRANLEEIRKITDEKYKKPEQFHAITIIIVVLLTYSSTKTFFTKYPLLGSLIFIMIGFFTVGYILAEKIITFRKTPPE